MINAVQLYLPTGDKGASLTVGVDGVKKIFFDKEDKDTLVCLMEDNIVTYKGFLVVAQKDYKQD